MGATEHTILPSVRPWVTACCVIVLMAVRSGALCSFALMFYGSAACPDGSVEDAASSTVRAWCGAIVVFCSDLRLRSTCSAISYCMLCSFMVGWHVHEKAILMVIVPLG